MDPIRSPGPSRYVEGRGDTDTLNSLRTEAVRPDAALRDYAAPMGYRDSVAETSTVGGLGSEPDIYQEKPLAFGAAGGALAETEKPDATPPDEQKKVPFYKKKKFIIAQCILIPIGIAMIFILLYPVVHAIAQHVINVSVLNVATAAITNPQNTSFGLAMTGVITHTGIFNAKIMFTENITVSWLNGTDEVPLGYMYLDTIYAKNKRATVNQTTTFYITEEANFGDFTAAMITRQNFTWRLASDNLKVQALKFPMASHLKFRKDTFINGINNFDGQAKLIDFELPHDDPAGGITYTATTQLNNTSPFNVELGTVLFGLYYQGVFLGNGTGTNVTIVPNIGTVTLDGRLISHATNQTELALLGQLFSSYLNSQPAPVIAKGISTVQPDGSYISWLSQGLQALELTVPFMPPTPINSIQSIDVQYLNLTFTPETAWAPLTSSNNVSAVLKIPFGFNISIGDISNTFSIVANGSTVGSLSTPEGSATSDIKVLGPADTEGSIDITIANIPLNVSDSSHTLFSQFNHDLTVTNRTDFNLIGHARAVANMSIGQIVLDPINFNVTNGLLGLDGLNYAPTLIDSVDVVGGTTEYISLGINVTMFNPSNLNLNTGDLVLELFRNSSLLGYTLLPNLSLVMGNNTVSAIGQFMPNNSPEGQDALNRFVGQLPTPLQISGFSGSTNVSSLLQAFEALQVNTTLPGLNTTLLNTTSLTILSTTGITNNISTVTVSLVNPFTASLFISSINSTVTSNGINLGTILQSVNFMANGKSTTTSPALNLDMNLDPSSIFTLTKALALQAGLSTEQLDGIVALGNYSYIPTSPNKRRRAISAEEDDDDDWELIPFTSHVLMKEHAPTVGLAKRNIYTGFDLVTFVDTAFKKLTTDVTLQSTVNIGDYQTNLAYTQKNVPVATDQTLNLLLPVLAKPIVQKIVDGSMLSINTIIITDPTATTFGTELTGWITQAGPFDATIAFNSGLTVTWAGQELGTMLMPNVSLVGDVGATINVSATFQIANVAALTNFTTVLLTEESFDWTISGTNLTVSALGVDVPNISISKNVTIKGMNGLKGGVVIDSFDLPANDPAGGVHLTLATTITNPSQVGVSLSSIGFQNYYQTTYIGPAAASPALLLPLAAASVPLAGRLVPQTSSGGLADVSTIFTNYIHGIASNLSVHGDTAGPAEATWLNDGIKALVIEVSLPAPQNLQVIKSITLEQLTLMFTPDTAYAPISSSNDATAAFQLPFAFPLDIVALSQTIDVSYKGTDMAQLMIPKGPSTTDVAARIIHLTFSMVPFSVLSGQDSLFQDFLADTTLATTQTFHLSGSSNTDAQTAIGLLSISNITFSVDTSMAGLQGLNARPANVSNLDVAHGYSDYLLITLNTGLFNPSNITIGTGDVAFSLQFNGQVVGTADISNATIVPGESSYATDVHYQPQGGAAVAAGQTMLENFLQGIDSTTTITGTSDTTNVDSLKEALSDIKLSAVIPALHQNLITSATLEFPTDIVQTGLAQASFVLSNPFSASINLLKVFTNATYKGVFLGTINVDESSSPIHADGHTNITSPTLPLKYNLDPLSIVQLLTLAAASKGVNMGPLPSLFQIVESNPNFQTAITTTVDTSAPTCVSGQQFDVDGAILDALAGLQVDLGVSSDVKLDDFPVHLDFAQHNVPAITDKTALYLIGAVAPPIVQTLVNQASLTFSEANITDITDSGFSLSLAGALTGTGSLDAEITFVEPIIVAWQGTNIATIALPPVCAAANSGVPNYRTNAQLAITDLSAFTDFATYLLHNPSFDWTISTNKLRLTALGTIFDNVSLTKTITFKAFNNLPGVTISNFQLPADDPAGGITISTDSLIPSQSNLGIELGTVVFDSYFDGVFVGPLTGSNLFLAPLATTTEHLTGRIVPQSGSDLDTLGTLFSNFLAGQNQTLQVKGDSVSPGGSEVSWLSTAFKTLTLNVILPGHVYQIIDSIKLFDLEVTMTEASQAYAPLTSNEYTYATYQNPFGFSLQAIESGQNITIAFNGVDTASLNLPLGPVSAGVSTGNVAPLVLSFHDQILHSLNNDAFGAFFAQVTDTSSATFELKGTAAVIAKTAIGNVPISGIPFNVSSSLAGINSFGGTVTLTNVSITGSGNGGQYILSPLTTELNNPSNVTLHTNDIALPVYYSGVMIGRAVINPFDLVPGANTVPSEFHYMPANPNDTVAQSFLTAYLEQSGPVPLTIKGDSESSPYGSLIPALEGATLTTAVQAIDAKIVTHINAYLELTTLVNNEISIDFDVLNPLDATLDIEFVQNGSGVNGEIYAHFDQAFSSFTAGPRGTANSGRVDHVLLTKGAVASLPIIPLGYLDIFIAQTVKVGDYETPWLHYQQAHITTSYFFSIAGVDVSLSDLINALEGLLNPSSSISSTSLPISIPSVSLPSVSLPSVSLAPLVNSALGATKVIPSLTSILPTVKLPTITPPSVNLPSATLPKVSLPLSL